MTEAPHNTNILKAEAADSNARSSAETNAALYKNSLAVILNKRLGVNNIDTFADDALAKLVSLIEKAVASYKETHAAEPEMGQLNSRELEDRAFSECGLENIETVLDAINRKCDQIREIDEFIKTKMQLVGRVITPPDENLAHSAEHEGSDPKEILPRLKTLLYILQNDLRVDLETVSVTTGVLEPHMRRDISYVTVEVPTKERIVQVCDEAGNVSYVFDTKQTEKSKLSVDDLNAMSKEEKNIFILHHHAAGERLPQSPEWREHMIRLLVEPIRSNLAEREDENGLPTGTEGVARRVEVSEFDPWRGFWANPNSPDPASPEHWGTRMAICIKSGITPIVGYEAAKPLSWVPILDVLGRPAKGYMYEDFIALKKIKSILTLPRPEESGEWKGFCEKDGRHFGTIMNLGRKLGVSNPQVYRFIKKLKPADMQIIDSNTLREEAAYCYEDMAEGAATLTSIPNVEAAGPWRGFYEKEGKHYGTLGRLTETLKLGRGLLNELIEGGTISSEIIRTIGGPTKIGYAVEDIKESEVFKKYDLQPRVAEDGPWAGFYTENKGAHWGTWNATLMRLGITGGGSGSQVKRKYAEGTAGTKKGVDSSGKIREMVLFEEVEKIV